MISSPDDVLAGTIAVDDDVDEPAEAELVFAVELD